MQAVITEDPLLLAIDSVITEDPLLLAIDFAKSVSKTPENLSTLVVVRAHKLCISDDH